MKNMYLSLGIAILSLTSCGAYIRGTTGATKGNLIKTVAIEQDCPENSIKIVNEVRRAGSATYSLDACGKKVVYKQVGFSFVEASKAGDAKIIH
ncbi:MULTISPECIES: hypothetical protein [Elizabethkingia]|uniref:hypothetical protein n=1 Tax=Elizabethkingia TaxID=308865 RepID=UPI00099A5C09|nr:MULTISPECIES: hypothetical protein [Elizabethkingia]MCT3759649.1 hypothetical protein [Elizabethkingia anophelis]MCT3974440.1 hypothetical protein [Elizabethkingia anophelis]OPC71159.1 hypothetical protein BAZ13_09935 [Elizabethkingia miricola]WQM40044.1 hypothetical protein U2S95_07230 [Elizabethkingia miricola]